jgi:lysophospholipase L1-like esterase
LILGGSVAFASYASSIETTYFHRLGRGLEAANLPTRIDVLAAGAWKVVQEVRALRLHITEYQPDLVVLLDGLNDLTVGPTSEALFELGESEGSAQRGHARDYPRRVADYLRHVREAAEIASAHGSALLLVLQPSLVEHKPLSSHERDLVRGTVRRYGSVEELQDSYEAIRKGLRALEAERLLTFLDASRAFNAEPYTTFADTWHFGDAGHRILADRMVVAISAILGGSEPERGSEPSRAAAAFVD